MSSSVIRLICPNLQCRAILAVPTAARGKTVRCRQCSMRVQVPSANPGSQPAVRPAETGEQTVR